MNKEIIAEGVRRFAEVTDAKLRQESDLLFEVTFPGDPPAMIGIEGFGSLISYATSCRVIDTELAPTLLRRNWGGVESTCFYFSVLVEDGEAWLVLETRQLLDPSATSESVVSTLRMWRLQYLKARESLQR